MVRYTETGKVLDYLAEFNARSIQSVEYGKNLLDVKITRDHTERITALIPLGAKEKTTDAEGNETETDTRIDITSVNDGVNYVYDADAVKEIGWIWTTEIWDANARLTELISGITSMELTIIDESDTGSDIGSIHARQFVDCISTPHGIDGRYACMSKTIDYLNSSGNTITIGASGIKLTSISAKQNQNITELSDDLLGKTEVIKQAVTKAESAETAANEAKDTVNAAFDDISVLQENVRECYSEITKTSEQINLAVREEYISRTEMEIIQRDFESSITQNSTEIRMDFNKTTDEIKDTVAINQALLEEYIRFKGALIKLGKVGNAFTAELSNEELAFKENGQKIAYISNQSLVITNAEIRNKLSLGNESRGWFDFIPRTNGNLSIKWRAPSS